MQKHISKRFIQTIESSQPLRKNYQDLIQIVMRNYFNVEKIQISTISIVEKKEQLTLKMKMKKLMRQRLQ